jgi:cyclohexa-1,5-dienecarbonyl-CoA hydratase
MPDVRVEHAPGRLRLILDAPHGNAITDAMVAALREAVQQVRLKADTTYGTADSGANVVSGFSRTVKLITIESAGPDFCFGSSLDEHTAARMPAVLPRFHALVRDLLRVPAVTAAVVSGRCLGGGFEVALACDVIFASDDAVMGLPEITVGAFPPVGSVLLPLKAGASRAASAIVGGAARPAADWQAAGLIEAVVPRGELIGAINRWYTSTIARHSAAALQRAAAASRLVISRAIDDLLPVAERLYLDDLLTTADAAEGVAAFLEKRPPRWTDS